MIFINYLYDTLIKKTNRERRKKSLSPAGIELVTMWTKVEQLSTYTTLATHVGWLMSMINLRSFRSWISIVDYFSWMAIEQKWISISSLLDPVLPPGKIWARNSGCRTGGFLVSCQPNSTQRREPFTYSAERVEYSVHALPRVVTRNLRGSALR